ncbi:uncharacterized protein LOC135704503 [Ochlerotatus camptorhynchus]|uniref:uncharacterized protein LOC135704503 n=1 Tax=Ochlerotatus camptorhynchus TaxID=644619 RepID=UPI0031D784C8
MWSTSIVILIVSSVITCYGQHSTPIVNIQGLGNVQGSVGHTSWTNRTIYSFQGIPYGQAPIGDLRFRPTVKVGAWSGTKDASKPGIRCPQLTSDNVDNEDCLTLSVYSNSLDTVHPVMVYIHGGWFFAGGADDYKPDFLLESDIVLVVIQYRLGPLGFLSAMNADIPGNVGMLDVIAALDWVQQYIGYFGGNSSQVTIFGESAGAAAVSVMLHSPLVQSRMVPLFQKAILQSGSVFAPWAISDEPLDGTNDIVRRLGCTGTSMEQCFRGASVRSLLEAFAAHRSETVTNRGYPYVAGTGIVVGGPSELFPQHPINYLESSNKDIAVMAGTTSQDGLFLLDELHQLQPQLLKSLNSSHELLHYVRTLHGKFGHTNHDGSLEAYALGDNFLMREIDQLRWEDLVASLTDICGKHGIKAPVVTEIHAFSRVNPGNVYLYSFDYSSALTKKNLNVPFPHKGAVHHAEDLQYLFPREELNADDIKMAKTMVQLWTSFAIRGVPSAKDVSFWPPADRLFGPYLKINTKSEQRNNYLNEFTATADKYRTYGAGSRMTGSIGSIFAVVIVGFASKLSFTKRDTSDRGSVHTLKNSGLQDDATATNGSDVGDFGGSVENMATGGQNGPRVKLPPLVVKSVPLDKVAQEMATLGVAAEYKLCGIGTKIILHTKADYNEALASLKNSKVEFFTHDMPGDKPFRVVFLGLPNFETKVIEIKDRFCTKDHASSDCPEDSPEVIKCVNCGGAHQGSSSQCPKREEFKRIRKDASTSNQPGHRGQAGRNGISKVVCCFGLGRKHQNLCFVYTSSHFRVLLPRSALTMSLQLGGSVPVFDEAPEIALPNLGTLRGSTAESAFTGRKILQFLSVKYGETTAGEYRFKPPRKALPWEGVRDVSRYGLPCPQLKLISLFNGKQFAPDVEDCLTLSVYTNQLSGSKPVMFFIHGGGFYEGAGSNQTPEFLLEKDIVLVVVQYRLGPLGFLSTRTEAIPGNAGLMDIKLALEWVRDNIGHFGGDAGNVTLFGQSAGAAAVSALMYSPMVPENLFHKVILQSGGSSAPWVWDKDPAEHAREIATIMGCDPNADKPRKIVMPLMEVERCMHQVDVWHLLRSFIEHKTRSTAAKGLGDVGGNRLTVQDYHGFLPQKPWEMIKAGRNRPNLPMMAGVVKHEGTFLLTSIYDGLKNRGLLDDPNFVKYGLLEQVNKILGAEDPSGSLAGYQIRSLFSQEQLASGKFENLTDGLNDLAGTILVKAALLREAQANSAVNPNGTFLYSFDYRGEQTRFGYGADTSHYPFDGGVHHSNDLLYLFPFPPGEPKLNEGDAKIARKMVDLWTSFAATGVPRSELTGDVEWKPMSDYAGPYLHIDESLRLGSNFYEEFTVASDEKRRSSLKGAE